MTFPGARGAMDGAGSPRERTAMKKKLWTFPLGSAALAALALVGAAVALAAGGSRTHTLASTTGTRTPETALTGDVATKATAAAIAKVGGTADAATTENDGTNAAAAYEVHVTKTDGSHVTVSLDKD